MVARVGCQGVTRASGRPGRCEHGRTPGQAVADLAPGGVSVDLYFLGNPLLFLSGSGDSILLLS
jgi:hypothetical protein